MVRDRVGTFFILTLPVVTKEYEIHLRVCASTHFHQYTDTTEARNVTDITNNRPTGTPAAMIYKYLVTVSVSLAEINQSGGKNNNQTHQYTLLAV